jgi:hypothetical protein
MTMAKIGMLLMHGNTPRDLEAHEQLAAALPDAKVTEPDELGVFEVEIDAADQDAALQQVWNAVTLSGTDDHILFMEHPELPEYWRQFSGSPDS